MSQKITKVACLAALGLGLAMGQLQAAISINVTAEKLKDSAGFDMAVSGVLVLVGSTTDANFSGPSETSFVQDDDAVVAIWEIAADGGNTPGAFSGGTGSVSLGGDWDAGDPLAIYWFPTLTAADPVSSTVPVAAIPYGMFQGTGGVDGSDDWTTPADGTIGYNLKFITTDATVLEPGGGSTPAAEGEASMVSPGTGPGDPSGIAAAVDGLGIEVTWTDNATDETGFRVERSVDGSGVWTILDGGVAANSTSYTDNDVEGSTDYLYRVIALRGPSQSAYDEMATPVTSAAASARP